jgi:hypothetical protein
MIRTFTIQDTCKDKEKLQTFPSFNTQKQNTHDLIYFDLCGR